MSNRMPVFTILAKDNLALVTLRFYQELCYENNLLDQAHEVEKAIGEMGHWQDDHSELMKMPDHKHVPVNEEV